MPEREREINFHLRTASRRSQAKGNWAAFNISFSKLTQVLEDGDVGHGPGWQVCFLSWKGEGSSLPESSHFAVTVLADSSKWSVRAGFPWELLIPKTFSRTFPQFFWSWNWGEWGGRGLLWGQSLLAPLGLPVCRPQLLSGPGWDCGGGAEGSGKAGCKLGVYFVGWVLDGMDDL